MSGIRDIDLLLFYRLYNRFRSYSVLFVERNLHVAAALRLGKSGFYGIRHPVGIKDDVGIRVSCRPPYGLNEASGVAQETFLVGIEDTDETDFGDVQTFAEQVDADENVEFAQPQFADDLGSLDGVDIRVEIPRLYAFCRKILGQFLGEFLRERSYEGAVSAFDCLLNLFDEVLRLTSHGSYKDLGIDKPRRSDNLLNDLLGVF